MSVENGFRVFTARTVFGWIFLAMVLTLVFGGMPYQVTVGAEASIPWKWAQQTIAVVASTTVLVSFFIPNQFWSILSFISLLLFTLCYDGAIVGSFFHFGWWAVVTPFCLSNRQFAGQLRYLKIPMAIFGVIAVFSTKEFNPSLVPSYTLYLLPFLPWQRLYTWFENQFEPK